LASSLVVRVQGLPQPNWTLGRLVRFWMTLNAGSLPSPTPQPVQTARRTQNLVRVHATAVNLLDSKVRDGELRLPCGPAQPGAAGGVAAAAKLGRNDEKCGIVDMLDAASTKQQQQA
jgi:hypothetical protein